MMERVVIIGAGSFIGKNLIKELHASYRLKLVETNLRYIEDVLCTLDRGDIEQEEREFSPDTDYEALFDPGDIVIHLASSTNPTTSNVDIFREISTNVLSSARMFDACVTRGVKRVVFASSGGTVYGKNVRCPIKETDQTDPINSYGLQKLTIEKMLYVYNITRGLDYRIARLSNPYGPYQRPNGKLGVVTTFLYNALKGKAINVYGDGSVVRDFIYIGDAVKAIRPLIERECRHRVYNIGSGRGMSIQNVLQIIKEEVGGEIKVTFGEGRSVDVPENYLDISRFNSEFNEGAPMSLAEGIHLTRRFLESGIYDTD